MCVHSENHVCLVVEIEIVSVFLEIVIVFLESRLIIGV